MRVGVTIGTALLFALTSWPAAPAATRSTGAQPSRVASDEASDEAAFYTKTNQLRASKGVQQLALDSQLQSIARRWSAHMAASNTLSHNPNLAQEVTENWMKLGENVGTGPTVDAINQAFINSPHHYANLVDPAFQYIGIGVAYGSNGALWVTEDFMQLAGAPPPPPPPRQTLPSSPPRQTSPPPPPPRTTTAAPTTTSTTMTCPVGGPPPTAGPCQLPAVVSQFEQLDANS